MNAIWYVVPWLLSAVKGAAVLSVAIFVSQRWFPDYGLSWWLLLVGIPNHLVADFAGFVHVFYMHSPRKEQLLGRTYLVLVTLAIFAGIIFGVWAGLVVFLEGWLIGLPGGAQKTHENIDAAAIRGIDLTQPD